MSPRGAAGDMTPRPAAGQAGCCGGTSGALRMSRVHIRAHVMGWYLILTIRYQPSVTHRYDVASPGALSLSRAVSNPSCLLAELSLI